MHQTIGQRLLAFLLAALLLASLSAVSLAETASKTRELTLEDLKAMNDGNLIYTTNDSGYITFLRGNYYDGLIKNSDDVLLALEGVGHLLGADDTTGYVTGNCLIDDQQYRYYTLYQWQDDTAVSHAIVKVIVDPNGKGVALSSSIVNGVAADTESLISPEQALAVVKEQLASTEPDTAYIYFENDVTKMRTQKKNENDDYVLALAYVVYTNNPNVARADNGLAYLAHYVSATGEYLYCMPISSIGNEYALQGNDAARTFEGKATATYSGTVVGQSGKSYEITVPVMLDESTQTYYLADPTRKIAVADQWEYAFNNAHVALLSSKDNADWDADALLAYSNYILTYDFFSAVGWKSTDGLGTPILLLTDYVDEDHNPINNTSYQGKQLGWQVFCATSRALNAAETLDIIAHEFTHGVTTASVTYILYENQYGAINESMSDIMGNLVEMLSGRTEDTDWLVGEGSGEAGRNMSDPHSLGQPEAIGDIYFVPDTDYPGKSNDRGGVHLNNSLLAGIAPKLEKAGMTLEEERLLWTTFICALTPRTGYAEANLILPFAADIAGLDQHQDIIAKALDEIGMNNTDPFGAPAKGQVMVTMEVPESLGLGTVRLIMNNPEGHHGISFPQAGTNKISILLPPGAYGARFSLFDKETRSHEIAVYYFDGVGWTKDKSAAVLLKIGEGETLALPYDDTLIPPAATN